MGQLSFEKFLASPWPNYWIEEPGLHIYVRKTWRIENCDTIDLANITADVPGRGALTKFLDRYEPDHIFYVENIFNNRLVPYLERRGYVVVNREYPWCMIRLNHNPAA
jgi:hypothetical protein